MLESKKKSIAEQQDLKDTLAFCMNYDQMDPDGVLLFLSSVFNETPMVRATNEMFGACRAARGFAILTILVTILVIVGLFKDLRAKEDNLKQMNAIYDSNPNILQDFHSALQNGISV